MNSVIVRPAIVRIASGARRQLVGLLLLFALEPVSAASLQLYFSGPQGAPLAGVVVMAYAVDGTPFPFVTAPAPAEMVQQDKAFDPHVLIVPQHSAVSFPNLDRVRHHVYSFSPAKTFELELYQGVPSDPVLFDQAGVVALGCNIHDRMKGFVFVLDTAAYARSGADGLATLEIPGNQVVRLKAWHPRLKSREIMALGRIEAGASERPQAYSLDVLAPEPEPKISPLQQKFNRFRKN